MKKSWNKKEISHKEKKKLRKLFFQKQPIKEIEKNTDLTQRVIYRYVKENKWDIKRERYWLFIIKIAYNSGRSIEKVCRDSGVVSINILRRIKQKYNIKTRRFNIANKIIDENIEINMIRDYKKLMSAKNVAVKYGFKTHKTVIDVLNKYNINIREPKIITNYNTDYFKKINSHDKAYILGFLLTDGYVLKDYQGIGIQLQERDGYILEKMAFRIGPSTSIIHISCQNKRDKAKMAGDTQFINVQDMKRLTVHNREISEDLKKVGVIKNKTYILRCPRIKSDFLSSFFRGLWDGDGSVGIDKNGRMWCKLTSASRIFLEELMSICSLFKFSLYKINCKNDFYNLNISGGQKETVKFLRWMYKNKNDMYLKRKYEKVQNKIN